MDPTDWLPTYPDLLPRRPSPRWPSLAAQPPYNTEIFPVPDVLADLTFLPSFPDQVPHVTTTREQTVVTTAAILVTAIAPLAWLPHYPGTVPHRRLPAGGMLDYTAAPPGYQTGVAASGAWRARYPDAVPHRRPLQPGGSFDAVLPAVAAAGELCVDLGLEGLTTPALLAEALTTPTMIEEGLGTPALLDEDLCP
jgi:hypothetical protein